MAVITISRQFGSGGNEIADVICQMTGYHHFDKSLIAQAASEVGITAKEIVNFSEENYKVRSFFERLFARPRSLGEILVSGEDFRGIRYYAEEMTLSEEQALSLVQKAILTAYNTGNIVIVGRGGQVILKDSPDVLHVRIEAPLEDRIQRIKAEMLKQRTESQDLIDIRRMAQDLIETRDAASADYLKNFYDVDWSDPFLYHLVINTGKTRVDLAAQMIAQMVQSLLPLQKAEA